MASQPITWRNVNARLNFDIEGAQSAIKGTSDGINNAFSQFKGIDDRSDKQRTDNLIRSISSIGNLDQYNESKNTYSLDALNRQKDDIDVDRVFGAFKDREQGIHDKLATDQRNLVAGYGREDFVTKNLADQQALAGNYGAGMETLRSLNTGGAAAVENLRGQETAARGRQISDIVNEYAGEVQASGKAYGLPEMNAQLQERLSKIQGLTAQDKIGASNILKGTMENNNLKTTEGTTRDAEDKMLRASEYEADAAALQSEITMFDALNPPEEALNQKDRSDALVNVMSTAKELSPDGTWRMLEDVVGGAELQTLISELGNKKVSGKPIEPWHIQRALLDNVEIGNWFFDEGASEAAFIETVQKIAINSEAIQSNNAATRSTLTQNYKDYVQASKEKLSAFGRKLRNN